MARIDAKNKRLSRFEPTINAGSTADIAFLLLVFFLISTTLLPEEGITVRLPPWSIKPPAPIPERNVLNININGLNELSVEGSRTSTRELKQLIKAFVLNPEHREDFPRRPKSAIISFHHDRATSYTTYLEVYNEIKAAYNNIWNEEAISRYGEQYGNLSKTQKNSIKEAIPFVISEAEAVNHWD